MAEHGALEIAISELTYALAPLIGAAQEQPAGSGLVQLALEVGVDLGPAMTPAEAGAFANAAVGIYNDLLLLVDDPDGFVEHIPEALDHLIAFTSAIDDLDLLLPAPQDLTRKLFDYLVFSYVERRAPALQLLLVFLGIFVAEDVPAAGGLPDYIRREIRWDWIPKLLKPKEILHDIYGWGEPNFDSNLLLSRLDALIWSIGLPSHYKGGGSPGTDGVMNLFLVIGLGSVVAPIGVRAQYLPPAGTDLPGLSLIPAGMASADQSIPIGAGWNIHIELNAEASAGFGLSLRPGGNVALGPLPGAPAVSWKLGVELGIIRATDEGSRIVLFGPPDGARLEAQSVEMAVRFEGETNQGDIGVEMNVVDGQVVIAAGEGDGFLGQILPPDGIAVGFEFTLGWSSKRGLYFRGSGGLETTLPVQLNLGPLRVDSVYLRLRVRDDGRIGVTVAASPVVDISVLVASVERIGIELAAELGTSPKLDILFNPPTGVGILIDAGPVTGGGYLSFDYENGRYAGILQLQIYSFSLTAIGLLDTKLPGGQSGYSFLIIITAKFPPIQLGYGFTLNGAGGLAGIHRTIVIDALQSGVRAGSVDHILFPEDPIRDAAIIISDLRTFFPPAIGRFVFGPMVLIGWGTPTLITVELGIIIELPLPIRLILLGQISATIPTPDEAVVELHLDILGVLDFEAKQLSIDATIRDSRIAVFALSGDMAMRLNWGDKPNFAFAVGGWNPHFQPPPGFPELRRITVALGTGENPRINMQAYFALTANSVQMGALAELYAEYGGFSINGWIGFDVLFIFIPFSFRTDFSAGVAIRRGQTLLAGVHLDATLTGPSPFHAWGEASISILFITASVPFDATFGETKEIEAPERDPWELLEPAVRDIRNWNAELPPGTQPVVALRKPSPDSQLVIIEPGGTVTFRQKVVPLNFAIDKFGEAKPTGPGRYDLTGISISNTALAANERKLVQDRFARGQFRKMTDQQKLSIPSFEPMDSGMRITDQNVSRGAPLGRDVEYETIIIDSKWESRLQPSRYSLPREHQMALMGASAKARSTLENSGFTRFQRGSGPKQFELEDEQYLVVSTDDLTKQSVILTAPTTQGGAHDALDEYLVQNPADYGKYQVVPAHEAL